MIGKLKGALLAVSASLILSGCVQPPQPPQISLTPDYPAPIVPAPATFEPVPQDETDSQQNVEQGYAPPIVHRRRTIYRYVKAPDETPVQQTNTSYSPPASPPAPKVITVIIPPDTTLVDPCVGWWRACWFVQ